MSFSPATHKVTGDKENKLMKQEIEQLELEVGNIFRIVSEYDPEDLKHFMTYITDRMGELFDAKWLKESIAKGIENAERYSNGNRKEALEQNQLEQHLEDNGSSQPIG